MSFPEMLKNYFEKNADRIGKSKRKHEGRCHYCGSTNVYVADPQICKDEDLQLECHDCGRSWET